jgi:hypothetical protein
MRGAAHHIGRAHDIHHATGTRPLSGRHGGRELGDGDALFMGLGDMLFRRVVMAGERHVEAAAEIQDLPAVDIGINGHLLLIVGDHRGKVLVVPALVAVEGAEAFEIAPLPLARRVVHDRDQPQQRMIRMGREHLDDVGIGDLAAQMEEVFGAQQAAGAGLAHAFDGIGEDPAPLAAVAVVADADRVEHRRDAGADDLGIMREHGGHGRGPDGAGARFEMLLHIVGMDLDQAGQQIIAFEVVTTRHAGIADLGDAPVGHAQRAFDHRVGGHDPRVVENQFVFHAAAL